MLFLTANRSGWLNLEYDIWRFVPRAVPADPEVWSMLYMSMVISSLVFLTTICHIYQFTLNHPIINGYISISSMVLINFQLLIVLTHTNDSERTIRGDENRMRKDNSFIIMKYSYTNPLPSPLKARPIPAFSTRPFNGNLKEFQLGSLVTSDPCCV